MWDPGAKSHSAVKLVKLVENGFPILWGIIVTKQFDSIITIWLFNIAMENHHF